MARKCLILLLAVLLLFSAAACRRAETIVITTPTQPEEYSTDLESIFQRLLDLQKQAGEEPVLYRESADDPSGSRIPRLTEMDLKQKVIYASPTGEAAYEVVLVETGTEEDMPAVREALQARIDAVIAGGGSAAALWKQNAQLKTDGCYAALLVLPASDALPDDLFHP